MQSKPGGQVRLVALVDLADKGVTVGYEQDPRKLAAYALGLKVDRRSLVLHRDPALPSTGVNGYFIIAVYTNLRDRPIYSLYCRLRMSPRARMMTSCVQRPVLPGERVAFIFHVQKDIAPQVAHFNFSEFASGLDNVGQAIVQHVPKMFLSGIHSASATAANGGLKEVEGTILADAQPSHIDAPSSPIGFIQKNLGR